MEDEEFELEEWDKEEGFNPVGFIIGIVFYGSLIYLIIENGIFIGFILWLFLLVVVVPAIFAIFD